MTFSKLSNDDQRKFARLCVDRRKTFEMWKYRKTLESTKDILIVADRPGPKAPQQDDFHHTPFYSKLHSGGWLNALMVEANITEDRLMWHNSATWDNKPEDPEILQREWKHIIALGGNAEKWLKKNGVTNFWKFDHPQYWKRWKANEGHYPLISHLVVILDQGSFT